MGELSWVSHAGALDCCVETMSEKTSFPAAQKTDDVCACYTGYAMSKGSRMHTAKCVMSGTDIVTISFNSSFENRLEQPTG